MIQSSLSDSVTIYWEDHPYIVPSGISVAAAVLEYTHATYTTIHPIAHDKRAPYCMMGVCHECLMEIDGVPHRQACLTTVKNGMRIRPDRPITEIFR